MSNQTSKHPNHEEFVSLLPWFVNRTLDANKRNEVLSHIETCDECQREIRFLETMRDTLQNDARENYTRHADLDRNLASVMSRIDEKSQPSGTTAIAASSLLQRLEKYLGFSMRLPATQWGATAVAGFLVAVLGFQLYFNSSNDDYSVLSSPGLNDTTMRLSVEMTTSMNQQQAQLIIQQEAEKSGHAIDIEVMNDGIFSVVLKEPVGVAELSRLISELEAMDQVRRVEVQP